MTQWKTNSSQIVYTNEWYRVREDTVTTDEGKSAKYCVVERKPSVFIVPLTEQQETLLIRIFRYTTGITAWEVPGGGMMEGENTLDAAQRELQEETGITAEKFEILGEFQCANGISNQLAYTVIAKELDLSKLIAQRAEGIETVKKIPLHEALRLITTGEISDGQSIIALSQAALYLGMFEK